MEVYLTVLLHIKPKFIDHTYCNSQKTVRLMTNKSFSPLLYDLRFAHRAHHFRYNCRIERKMVNITIGTSQKLVGTWNKTRFELRFGNIVIETKQSYFPKYKEKQLLSKLIHITKLISKVKSYGWQVKITDIISNYLPTLPSLRREPRKNHHYRTMHFG